MKKLSMVRVRKDYRKQFESHSWLSHVAPSHREESKRRMDELLSETTFIYFGEIPNMPGHCVVSGHKSGKIFSGYHRKFYGDFWYELDYDKLPLRRGKGQVAVRRKINETKRSHRQQPHHAMAKVDG